MWKNKAYYIATICFILISIISCQKKSVDWIDSSAWKNDFKGCNGYRESLIPELYKRKDEFVGERDLFFFYCLGKPNKVEAGDRQKKKYFYYLTPGDQCEKNEKTQCLIVEFEALGSARTVYLGGL